MSMSSHSLSISLPALGARTTRKKWRSKPIFFSILDQCLLSIQQLEPQSFSALNLNDTKQYLISQKAFQVLELLEPESLPTIAFSIKNVLSDSNELGKD